MMPSKPRVSPLHSPSNSSTTPAKESVISAKYQVVKRNAGNAISAPAKLVITIAAGAASQNEKCASIIRIAVA